MMISVVERFRRVLDAKAHARVDGMEVPEEMLNQIQRELVAAVAEAKAALASARAWERRLDRQVAESGQATTAALAAAEAALREGARTMARKAMERKLDSEQANARLCERHARARQSVDRQASQLEKLSADLANLREKRLTLLQRERIAKSMQRAATSAACGTEPASLVLERIEDRVARREAAAEVCIEYAPAAGRDELDCYVRDRCIDDALDALELTIDSQGESS